jgi:hypothetical protein
MMSFSLEHGKVGDGLYIWTFIAQLEDPGPRVFDIPSRTSNFDKF